MTLRRLAPLVLTLSALAGPSPAAAQDDGVTVDPDSPTGKEYAIPLEAARRQAAGGGEPGSSGGAPLFGEGISQGGRAEGGEKVPDGHRRKRTSPDPGRMAPRDREPSSGAAERAIEIAARRPGAPDGGLSGLAVAGGGLLVLLGGLAAGLLFRRRSPGD